MMSKSCTTNFSTPRRVPTVLTLRNDKTLEYYDVLRKEAHMVARAGFKGDLEIPGDSTVSRAHATIHLFNRADGSGVGLKLIDNNSKFGTFINDGIENDTQITNGLPVVLKLRDRIRFGRLDSTWTVTEYPIVVCPSTLNSADKEILKESVSIFGGIVKRDWSEQCTHLCMKTITVTEKVLICLASAKSIVLPKYFTDLSKALSPGSLTRLPFCKDYQPVLAENLLNPNSVSMEVNNKRKTLFSGKTFIFSTMNQLNRTSKIIKAAGGKPVYYFDGILSDHEILNSKDHILMQKDINSSGEQGESYQCILEKLEAINKRPIPENEIGLAVVFSCVLKYCNPDFKVSLVNQNSEESNATESEILASDTEMVTVVESSEKCSVNIIPDSNPETQNSFKRPFEVGMEIDSNEIEIPQKRALLTNDWRKSNNSNAEDLAPLDIVNKPSTSGSDDTFKPSESLEPSISPNTIDSSVTTVADSQNVSIKNNYSAWLQANLVDKNDNNTNNFHSKAVENGDINKRKISNISSTFSNKDDDPFDYMDIDEIEKHPKKKPKQEYSTFFPMATTSTNQNDQPKTVETRASKVVDPNCIMNLLSEAKGTGEFIDTSKLSDKSHVSEHNENNNWVNSIIVETVKLIVSKPTQSTQSFTYGSNSNLQNFKKFKRKAPVMRIPHIVPLKLV